MIHKTFTLVILFLISSFSLHSQNVNIQNAQVVGEKFYTTHIASQSKGNTHSLHLQSCKTNDSDTLFYIFNIDKQGYIIISADSSIFPVLAFSDEGNIMDIQQSPAFDYWMKNLSEQIIYIKQHLSPIHPAWRNSSLLNQTKGGNKFVSPLLSCKWNQNKDYNYFCPPQVNGPDGKCYAGCVATMMAQIMYYYKYPTNGQGTHNYNHPHYGTISSDFSKHTFDWPSMKNIIDSASKKAIAQLIYNCGVSVNMNYSPVNSSATFDDVLKGLVQNFNYSIRMKYVHRTDYNSDYLWNKLLMGSIDAGIPLIYEGNDPVEGGHAFVCDGYKDSCFFHFNWGWGGMGDGYYYISNLSINTAISFTNNQGAIINVVPYDFPYCQTNINITEQTGTIEDGSESSLYWNNTNCEWLLTNPDNSPINIEFTSFQTEENKDVLLIYDGDTSTAPLIGQFSGHLLPSKIQSAGKYLLLKFVTDSINQDEGWKLKYSSVSLSLKDIKHSNAFSIYPNPAQNTIFIENLSSIKSIKIEIINALGQIILTKNFPDKNETPLQIDLSELKTGIYFIKSTSFSGTNVQKFIKE